MRALPSEDQLRKGKKKRKITPSDPTHQEEKKTGYTKKKNVGDCVLILR